MGRIQRENLRDKVRDEVRDRIVHGGLAPGSALREPVLSESLGVSRTPLREALLQLEREGMVRSTPARGFRVSPLTVEEVDEIFPVVGALQGLALRQGGAPADGELCRLREINDIIATGSAAGAEVVFAQDIEWHRRLLAPCTNGRLQALIATMHDATKRYDLAYFREAGDARVSASEHAAILDALEGGDTEHAARLLEAHWALSADPLREWLTSKERSA